MKRIVMGVVLLSFGALAQTNLGSFTLNSDKPDKFVQTIELNAARGAILKLGCVNAQLEVSLQPQVKLPATSNVQVSYRFDNSGVSIQRWNIGPFGGTLLLPGNLTRNFLTLGANASSLAISFKSADNVTQQYRFSVVGFRTAVSSLPCSGSYGFTPTTSTTATSLNPNIVDQNMAFIAPAEFVRVFGNGGSFQPQGSFLAWEYSGVRLLLQRDSTAVQSVFDNRAITLQRPVIEVAGRTVVPASLVSAFNCTIVGVTKPSDTRVKIGCGAGDTYVENDLTRY